MGRLRISRIQPTKTIFIFRVARRFISCFVSPWQADADLIDPLDAELDESLLFPIPTQATSLHHLRRNKKIKSDDASNKRDLQEDYGRDDHQSSTGSPTASPTGSPTGSPTASPTLYFSPSTLHDKREDGYTGAPSPSLLPVFNVIPEGTKRPRQSSQPWLRRLRLQRSRLHRPRQSHQPWLRCLRLQRSRLYRSRQPGQL